MDIAGSATKLREEKRGYETGDKLREVLHHVTWRLDVQQLSHLQEQKMCQRIVLVPNTYVKRNHLFITFKGLYCAQISEMTI